MLAAGNGVKVGLRLVVPADCRAEARAEAAASSATRSDTRFELSSTNSGKSADISWRGTSITARRPYNSGDVSPEVREKIDAALAKCGNELKEELGPVGERATEAIAGIFNEMMELGVSPPV